jgi:uncharacterized protein (TIGR04222 family)
MGAAALASIADMHGPTFLLLYAVVIVATLLGAAVWSRRFDATRSLPDLPVVAMPNPYELAYLRGGAFEAVRLAIFCLVERGYLVTQEEKRLLGLGQTRYYIQQAPAAPDSGRLFALEREVFNFFTERQQASRIWGPLLRADVERSCASLESALEKQQLLHGAGPRQSCVAVAAAASALLAGLGGYKLVAALAKGRTNVEFLVLMGIAGVVLVWVVCRPGRVTHRGRRYVQQLRLVHKHLSEPAAARTSAMSWLAMGLFGAAVLEGTAYGRIHDMFRRSTRQGSSWAGGCAAAGCGSGGGSGCGSGCGGGCGGGGCGGCGG